MWDYRVPEIELRHNMWRHSNHDDHPSQLHEVAMSPIPRWSLPPSCPHASRGVVPATPLAGSHRDLTMGLWGVSRPTTLAKPGQDRKGKSQCFFSDEGSKYGDWD